MTLGKRKKVEKAGRKAKLPRVEDYKNTGYETVTVFAQPPEDAAKLVENATDNSRFVFTAELRDSCLEKPPSGKSVYEFFEKTLRACLDILNRRGYTKKIVLRYAWLKYCDHRYSRGNLQLDLLRDYPNLQFRMVECAYSSLDATLPDNITNPEDMEDCDSAPLTPSMSSYPKDPMCSEHYAHVAIRRRPPEDPWELNSGTNIPGASSPGYDPRPASPSPSVPDGHYDSEESPRAPSYSPIRPCVYTHDRPNFEADSPSYEPGYDSEGSFSPTSP